MQTIASSTRGRWANVYLGNSKTVATMRTHFMGIPKPVATIQTYFREGEGRVHFCLQPYFDCSMDSSEMNFTEEMDIDCMVIDDGDDDLITASAVTVILVASALLTLGESQPNEPTRECWVSQLMAERERRGVFHTTLPTMEASDTKKWKNYLRMDSHLFNALLQSVQASIWKQDTVMRQPISPAERLALTLRYLATGESFTSLHYQFRIGKSTVAEIIPEVCEAIFNCLKDTFIGVPSTSQEWIKIAKRFNDIWNFPNCLGAVDGKHVVMRKPWHAGSAFHNYKNSESIVLMAVADADYR